MANNRLIPNRKRTSDKGEGSGGEVKKKEIITFQSSVGEGKR